MCIYSVCMCFLPHVIQLNSSLVPTIEFDPSTAASSRDLNHLHLENAGFLNHVWNPQTAEGNVYVLAKPGSEFLRGFAQPSSNPGTSAHEDAPPGMSGRADVMWAGLTGTSCRGACSFYLVCKSALARQSICPNTVIPQFLKNKVWYQGICVSLHRSPEAAFLKNLLFEWIQLCLQES